MIDRSPSSLGFPRRLGRARNALIRINRTFPEVETVFGKAGRALTATDPAPTEMFETIIQLKPKGEWRAGVTMESLRMEMVAALQFPGLSNAWSHVVTLRSQKF